MAYIGNQPISAAFLTDTFSGNGSSTAFTLTVAPANTSSILVAVTGVLQSPDTYSVSGTTLTFSAAPPSGTSNISVRYLGIPASGVTTTAYRTVTNTTATAGQTSFTIPSYTVGYVDVYRNGVYLPTSDYTATTGTTVVLNNAATVGDTITTISFYVSSVLNAIPTTGGTISGNLVITGTETVPTITSPAATALTLQTNNGTTALTLTSSGYPLTPLRPAFRAYVNANYNNTTGKQTMPFDTAPLNVGSGFSTSTNTFTAPVAGVYFFAAQTYWFSNGTASTYAGNIITVSGTEKSSSYIYKSASGGDQCVVNNYIGSLAAGDTVIVKSDCQAVMQVAGGPTNSYFLGYLIG